ncbi:MAG: MerR family transcriptional regulator [Gammaproteobacteria bacterium]|nr:MerR family transcriptional regulator [Gammaproteobacteria bacterium]
MNDSFRIDRQDEEPRFLIGQVAEMTGASCKAIRYYESEGLIPKPARRGKYRIYSELEVFLIHMCKHGQTVGFSLSEIKQLIDQRIKTKSFPLDFANELFDRKKAELREKIKEIKETENRLDTLRDEMNRTFT